MNKALDKLTQKSNERINLYLKFSREVKFCDAHYHEGASHAFSESRRIIEEELRELKLKFQNGYLTLSDFGV
jgi:hypothetical protein